MGAFFTRAGQIKYALPNDIYGLRIALSGGAFDAIIPFASTFVASSSGTRQTPYHVFINHHGQDVKHTLASKIYNSLIATGLLAFLDKDELKYGDLIPKALEKAMASASICISIFSEHYAESPWCLAELEYMVNNGKTIIPIFYHVDPADARWAIEGKRKYAAAFLDHEEKKRYAPEALQRWKAALQAASVCKGGTINSIGDDEKVVKEVVNRVNESMNTVSLEVAKYPVGLDEVVQDFDHTISHQSAGSRVNFIGIWGMGGSGKTTLAKKIFNRRCSRMDWSSFLSDVRDAAGKGLLLEKQKTLLNDLHLKDEHHENLDRGKQILKNRLSRSALVLIVLDDVDHIDQLYDLLPSKESFENNIGDQSLIMVTARDKKVLQEWGIPESAIYRMKPLEAIHAKQLFCLHAFKKIIPQQGFEDLVEEFLNACAGLPLSLKVLGGQLYGESDGEYWRQTLNKYSQIPHKDIKKRLKVSYDALEKQEQQMFLDVACFFIGERSSAAIAAWDAEFQGLIGWKTLFNKCLVGEDEDGLIAMHDHLRDLGRVIASEESAYRLWSPQQIIEILPQQEPIRVRGVASAFGDNCYERQGKIIIKTSVTNQEECSFAPWLGLKIFFGNGKFLSQEQSQLSKDLIWLQCTNFEHKNLPPRPGLENLRILDLSDSDSLEHLWAADADALLQLRELVIRNCECFAGFPNSIGRLDKLQKVIINDDGNTGCDALIDLPQEFCYLKSLEHLELIYCENLSSLPSNFGKLTELRHLNLTSCTKLEALPSNFGKLTELRHLELGGCTKLKALPDSFEKLTLLEYLSLQDCREVAIKSNVFENMTKLRYLNLEGCKKLEELRLPELVSLRDLHLKRTGVKELPANIFHLTNLTKLAIGNEFLITLPTSVGSLSPLTTLTIEECEKLKSLPDSLEHLLQLRELVIRRCRCFAEFPSSIGRFQKLEKILITDDFYSSSSALIELPQEFCRNALIELPQEFCYLKSLEHLELRSCLNLSSLPSNFGMLTNLRHLNLTWCTKLEALPDSFEKLTLLEYLSLEDCRKVAIKSNVFENMTKLRYLNLEGCAKLEELRLPELVSLRDLRLRRTGVKELPANIFHLTNLTKLAIGSEFLITLPTSVGSLSPLTTLTIKGCKKLKSLPDSLEHLSSLRDLTIEDTEVKCLPKSLIHLQSLRIESTPVSELSFTSWCMLNSIVLRSTKVSKISIGGDSCPALETLHLSGNDDLRELETLPEKLKTLNIRYCNQLEKIESLGNMRLLKVLEITDCPKLMVIACHSETSMTLKEIHLKKCQKLETIEGLKNIKSLENLMLHDCPGLNGLAGLAELTSLRKIDLQKCHNLTNIEDLENTRSLEEFIISDCQKLEALPSLPEIISQQHLWLRRCHKLKTIKGLESIKSLRELRISDCQELDGFPGLGELSSLKEIDLEMCPKLKTIKGLESIKSLQKLRISDCQELDGFPGLGELSSLKEFVLKMCPKLKKMEGLGNMTSLKKLIISDCLELESLPNLSEITSLEEFQLENCYKLEKIEGLERLRRLNKLRVRTRWNAPGIVSLEHSEKLQSLDVVANDISAVKPFVSNLETWPSEVMICSRAVWDVGLLKNFFQNMPNVSVLDYAVVLKADLWGEHLELSLPERSAIADATLICFIIDSDHPDLRLSISPPDDDEDLDLGCFTPQGDFNSELGEGKWVWMDVSTQRRRSVDYYYIWAHDSEGEDVEVVEAAWLVTGEEGSIVEAFRQHFQRNIFCSHGKGNMKNRATRRSSHKERRLIHMKNRSNRTRNHRRAEVLVPLPTPLVPTPHHHRVVSSAPTHLSALSSNLVQQWTQAVHAPPLGHVCTSYGGICTGPQSNLDAAHDGHYAEGADFDDDVYAAHGDGSDEIDMSSFVDLMQQGEPGESQEQQRMDDTVPPRRQYTLFSRPTDIGIPYTGLSTCTQIDVSTGPIPVSTEAQPQIHAEPYHTHPYKPQYSLFSTPSYDYRASLPVDTSVTLATTQDYVTMSVAKSSGLSQMEVPTSSFEDLTTAAFGSFHSAPPPVTEGHPSHVVFILICSEYLIYLQARF